MEKQATCEARSFEKMVLLGSAPDKQGRVFVTIRYAHRDGKGRLSISGVVGPKQNGDCLGSCGQIGGQPIARYESGWSAETVAELYRLWDRWHLNDMRAGCEHQSASWDATEKLEIVEYGLTTDAYTTRCNLRNLVVDSVVAGHTPILDDTQRALLAFRMGTTTYSPPDADGPLSGLMEVRKRGTKTAAWVKPTEHPKGLLCKPCPECGYQYGSEWKHESVPVAVIDWLASRPETVCVNPWGA